MDYEERLIAKYTLRWILGGLFVVVLSILWHWDYIVASVGNNLWAIFSAAMPSVIILVMIIHMIKSVFK